MCLQPHPLAKQFSESEAAGGGGDGSAGGAGGEVASPFKRNSRNTTLSKFLPTSRRLVQFSNGRVAPDGARIVYIDGAFDVFHPGHVKILQVGASARMVHLL